MAVPLPPVGVPETAIPPPQHSPATYAYLVDVLADFLRTTDLLARQDKPNTSLAPGIRNEPAQEPHVSRRRPRA